MQKIRKLVVVFSFAIILLFFFPAFTLNGSASSVYTEKIEAVHYNWGRGAPEGVTVDNFQAEFDQSRNFKAGDYFIQTLADDGVKVNVDGELKIDRWINSAGAIERALWMGVTSGHHNVKTTYYEDARDAAVFSDIVPFNSWLAYYYPTENLEGYPVAAKTVEPRGNWGQLVEDSGKSSPVPEKIGHDYFSARYVTAKRLEAGEYILRSRADDGIRVYIDGELVVDQWEPSGYDETNVKVRIENHANKPKGQENVHWVEVQYFERAGDSKVSFMIQPFSDAAEGWVAEYFPNTDLSGEPVIVGGKGSISPIDKLDFNWGRGTPHKLIPVDKFSARFTKNVDIYLGGNYKIITQADDGVRIYVDGQLVEDSWEKSDASVRETVVNLSRGTHKFVVEYFEGSRDALLNMDLVSVTPTFTEKTESVHYNWGRSAPKPDIPADNFQAIFDQSRNFTAGDYFIQTLADDGILVDVDGEVKIDRWSASAGKINRDLWTNVTSGHHTIKTSYYEGGRDAAVFSDIVPFNSWLAYYYPNQSLEGYPVAAKTIVPKGNWGQLVEDNGKGSPYPGKVGVDNFSVSYVTAKRLTAGEYVLRARADDGIRVYVDGELVLDQWVPSTYDETMMKFEVKNRTNAKAGEENVHWIEVQYFERGGDSKVSFLIQPFSDAKTSTDSWLGEFYSNKNLTGPAVLVGGAGALQPLEKIDFNWGRGTPHTLIPADNFSARFSKQVRVDIAGDYKVLTQADDGVRIFIDGKVVVDSWEKSDAELRQTIIPLTEGYHEVVVEYFEGSRDAMLRFDIVPLITTFTEKIESVHYNWGRSAPKAGIPADNFQAIFDQSRDFVAGDYFIQSLADDGIKIDVDDRAVINNWNQSSIGISRALWTNVSAGSHSVRTSYREDKRDAMIFSDIVPFGSWLAYYYPNQDLQGYPVAAKTISPTGTNGQLIEDSGKGTPYAGKIGNDNFSAKYVTAKRLPAGEYLLRSRADDGIRVYLDGELVVNQWTPSGYDEHTLKLQVNNRTNVPENEADIHWIEVEYFERGGDSKVSFQIQPYSDAKASYDNWLAEYYPNTSFTGTPIIVGGNGGLQSIPTISFDWGRGKPHPSIPADNFSVRYSKLEKVNVSGEYNLITQADDGVRVYINGNLVVDLWGKSDGEYHSTLVDLSKGTYEIVVEYFEAARDAKLKFELQRPTEPLFIYSNYDYTLDRMVDIQLSVNGTTDQNGSFGYINNGKEFNQEYIVKNEKGKWIVNVDNLNVRETSTTSSRIVGKFKKGDEVVIAEAGENWHKVWYTWKYAARDDIYKAVNPNNYINDYTNLFQFLKLSKSAGVNAAEVNQKVLAGKGILAGKASSFIDAGANNNINEVYLIAHALLETGNGSSKLANGIVYKDKTVYNMYGIGAYDNCPIDCGARTAYEKGWDTPEKAIVGGAQFIASSYIHAGQDTIYKMRWNPDKPGTHQYATDIYWASKQVGRIKQVYDLLSSYRLIYDIPQYR